jgi:hypothetical protein
MLDIAGRPVPTILSHEIGIIGHRLPEAAVHDVVGLATPVSEVEELWNWPGRVADLEPDVILWPDKVSPARMLFRLPDDGGIRVFRKAAVAPNRTTYSLYASAPIDPAALDQLNALIANAVQTVAPLEPILVGDQIAVFAHAPSHFRLPVPEGATAVTLGFGYEDRAWLSGNALDGASFVVRRGNGAEVMRRTLTPTSNDADRGPHRAHIRLEEGVETLDLWVEAIHSGKWDWTYWMAPVWDFSEGPDAAYSACPEAAAIRAGLVGYAVGYVGVAQEDNDMTTFGGWAADPQLKIPADRVIAVSGDRVLACTVPTIHRPDVIRAIKAPGAAVSGFALKTPTVPDVTIFAQFPGGVFARLGGQR